MLTHPRLFASLRLTGRGRCGGDFATQPAMLWVSMAPLVPDQRDFVWSQFHRRGNHRERQHGGDTGRHAAWYTSTESVAAIKTAAVSTVETTIGSPRCSPSLVNLS